MSSIWADQQRDRLERKRQNAEGAGYLANSCMSFVALVNFCSACCHFRAQKVRAHPFQQPSKWICPHQDQYVPQGALIVKNLIYFPINKILIAGRFIIVPPPPSFYCMPAYNALYISQNFEEVMESRFFLLLSSSNPCLVQYTGVFSHLSMLSIQTSAVTAIDK